MDKRKLRQLQNVMRMLVAKAFAEKRKSPKKLKNFLTMYFIDHNERKERRFFELSNAINNVAKFEKSISMSGLTVFHFNQFLLN